MINLHINALFFTFLNASVSFSIIIELHLTKLQRLPMLVLAKCKFELWELLRNQITKCRANQWTGFYMITASAMKELSSLNIRSEIWRQSSSELATLIIRIMPLILDCKRYLRKRHGNFFFWSKLQAIGLYFRAD